MLTLVSYQSNNTLLSYEIVQKQGVLGLICNPKIVQIRLKALPGGWAGVHKETFFAPPFFETAVVEQPQIILNDEGHDILKGLSRQFVIVCQATASFFHFCGVMLTYAINSIHPMTIGFLHNDRYSPIPIEKRELRWYNTLVMLKLFLNKA